MFHLCVGATITRICLFNTFVVTWCLQSTLCEHLPFNLDAPTSVLKQDFLKMTQFFKFFNHKALCGLTNTTKRFMDKQICWKRFTDKIVFLQN